MVMIGIDPHKRTHTAVAIDTAERVLDERLVRATGTQVPELLEWAKRLDGGDRIWAIESAGGLGYLLAQQLLAAGEHGRRHPGDAGVAGAAVGHGPLGQERPERRPLGRDRGAAGAASWSRCGSRTTPSVLRLLSRRHTQLGWSYNKTACRLHALVADLVPGGISKEVVVSQARSLLAEHPPVGAVAIERHAPRRRAGRRARPAQRPNARRSASGSPSPSPRPGTTLTEIFGIGDVGAAIIIGQVGDVARFPTADRFAAYNGTAPIEWSSGNPSPADPPALPTREPHPEPRHPHRRGHPAPAPPQPRPRVLRPQAQPRASPAEPRSAR